MVCHAINWFVLLTMKRREKRDDKETEYLHIAYIESN